MNRKPGLGANALVPQLAMLVAVSSLLAGCGGGGSSSAEAAAATGAGRKAALVAATQPAMSTKSALAEPEPELHDSPDGIGDAQAQSYPSTVAAAAAAVSELSAQRIGDHIYLKGVFTAGSSRALSLTITRASDGAYLQADGSFSSKWHARTVSIGVNDSSPTAFSSVISVPYAPTLNARVWTGNKDRPEAARTIQFAGDDLEAAMTTRAAFSRFAGARSVAAVNRAVSSLSDEQRGRLVDVVLNAPDATTAQRARLKETLLSMISMPERGIYAEILTYAGVFANMGCCYYTGGAVFVQDNLANRDMLMHELWHAFNARYRGANGSLDEGLGIFVFKALDERKGEGLAEAVYGTQLQIPSYTLAAATSPNAKLEEFARLIAKADDSNLPWDSTERLQSCFNQYWSALNRHAPNWPELSRRATSAMAADLNCRTVGTQRLNLQLGWNYVALPHQPRASDIATSMAGLGDAFVRARQRGADGVTRHFLPSALRVGDRLNNIDPQRPFWVYVSRPVVLDSYGQPAAPVALSLPEGRTEVRLASAQAASARELAQRLGSALERIETWENNGTEARWVAFRPELPDYANAFQTLKPGVGYRIKLRRAATVCLEGGC